MFTHTPQEVYIEKKDPWSSHSIIFEWVRKNKSGIKVLDVGCATGALGKKCKGLGFHLKGLEPVYEWAKKAEHLYDEVLCSNLEDASDLFLANQDIVVCADILEHTSSPERLLKRLVELQKPNTIFIISVPNIAHFWIRLNLLIGRFNYTNFGILDKGHLRFFTKKTFLKLLESSGLNLLEIKYTPTPLNRIDPWFETNVFGRLFLRFFTILANILPGLFAYQFVTRSEVLFYEKKD
jgi:2-polyprenyl-3-methyl-5-hydroxy-6-metoxy-1,4-benzoquinol methylase